MTIKNFSRRDFLGGTAAVLGASLAGCAGAPKASPSSALASPDAASAILGIDMHNHFYPAGTEPHPPSRPEREPTEPTEEERRPLSFATELGTSGLTAICASYVMDVAPNQRPGDARAALLDWFAAVDAELARGNARRALTVSDLQDAHAHKLPTIIQSVEGAHFIEGDLSRVEEVYERGLRHLQLLHEKDDQVSPLGDTNTGVAHLGGLTAFGAEVVKECNRLGMVIDLAHARHETVLATLKLTTQPVIISHTNLDTWAGANSPLAQRMRPRLLSKEHAQVVADAGGVIGVWTRLTDSLEELGESIKAMVDAIGVDHVGIGSDTDLLSSQVGKGTNRAYADMTGGFFNAVVREMTRQGFSFEEISKIGGGNYRRVFGAVTRSA